MSPSMHASSVFTFTPSGSFLGLWSGRARRCDRLLIFDVTVLKLLIKLLIKVFFTSLFKLFIFFSSSLSFDVFAAVTHLKAKVYSFFLAMHEIPQDWLVAKEVSLLILPVVFNYVMFDV